MQRLKHKIRPPPVDDVNNLWHHHKCQRALASTVIQIRRNALSTSPEYADHAMMKVAPDSKCVTECVKQGSKYALYDGKTAYVLSDQKTPEEFAGQRVMIVGTLYEKTKILKADSIKAAGSDAPSTTGSPHAGHQH